MGIETTNENKVIRLDARAHDLFHEDSFPDSNKRRAYVFDRVRRADVVIDARDQVIKDRQQSVPRAATMSDIEQSELIQG